MGEEKNFTYIFKSTDGQEYKMNGESIPEHREESPVNHPRHYNREGAIECIDEMELVFGPEATANFCLLNCWKYRYRAGLKNDGFQDLEKSDWYMNKYKELKEENESNKTNTVPSTNPWIITPNWPGNQDSITYTNTIASK